MRDGRGGGTEQTSGRLGFAPRPAAAAHTSTHLGAGDGYGWPCRVANSVAERHKGSNPFPSAWALVVKRTSSRASNAVFQVQILTEALGEWSADSGQQAVKTEDIAFFCPLPAIHCPLR